MLMLTRIDHIVVAVPDLTVGMAQYRVLGFDIHAGGIHPGRGTHNAIAFNHDDYIEVIAVRDRTEYEATWKGSHQPDGGLVKFVAAGGGIRYVALQTDNLAADVAEMRSRGVGVNDPIDGSRRTPSGRALRWQTAKLDPTHPLPLFLIQHLTPVAERRASVPRAGRHPNGVQRLERVYVVTDDLVRSAQTYAHVLGMPQPNPRKSALTASDMIAFEIGPAKVCIVQPCGEGSAADALARRGPGVFQALYRTASMDAVENSMASQGVVPYARAACSTGERALLTTPSRAGGAYMGFVGTA